MGRPAHSKRGSKVQVALYLTPEEIDYLVSRAPGGTTPSRALHGLLKDAMRGTPPSDRPHLPLPAPDVVSQAQPQPSQPVAQKKAQGKVALCDRCRRCGPSFTCPHCPGARQ